MTKKRRLVFIIILLILGVTIAGISYYLANQQGVVEDSMSEEKIVIDKQYLIDNCGITEEELNDVDVERFIEEWIEPYISSTDKVDCEVIAGKFDVYKDCLQFEAEQAEIEKSKKDDYAEMFGREYKGGYEDEYQTEITIIAVKVTDGSYRESIVFDLANQTYYFGELMDVTDDYSQATASGELSEEDVEAIRELVGEAEVSKWKADMGWVRPWDHDYSTYVMQIECSDGNSYGYTGIRKLPENFSDFYFGLKDVKDL